MKKQMKKIAAFVLALAVALPAGAVRTMAEEEDVVIHVPEFAPAVYGYEQPDAVEMRIENTRDTNITVSDVRFEGDTSAFYFQEPSSKFLPYRAQSTPGTIQPVAGLGAGTYTATIIVAYEETSVSKEIIFTVNKAPTPEIVWPEASDIIYTQKLADSVLSGGSTELGSFAWTDGEMIPAAGKNSYSVTFTPNAEISANYEPVPTVRKISVTADKAALGGPVTIMGDAYAGQPLTAETSLLTSEPEIS